jgi:hypothetical protein
MPMKFSKEELSNNYSALRKNNIGTISQVSIFLLRVLTSTTQNTNATKNEDYTVTLYILSSCYDKESRGI